MIVLMRDGGNNRSQTVAVILLVVDGRYPKATA
jgi:hypothetical protein